MKSGIVSAPIASVKLRSLGATTIQAKKARATAVGMNSIHGTPQSYVCPANPTNELVLAYVAKKERPISHPPIFRPPT